MVALDCPMLLVSNGLRHLEAGALATGSNPSMQGVGTKWAQANRGFQLSAERPRRETGTILSRFRTPKCFPLQIAIRPEVMSGDFGFLGARYPAGTSGAVPWQFGERTIGNEETCAHHGVGSVAEMKQYQIVLFTVAALCVIGWHMPSRTRAEATPATPAAVAPKPPEPPVQRFVPLTSSYPIFQGMPIANFALDTKYGVICRTWDWKRVNAAPDAVPADTWMTCDDLQKSDYKYLEEELKAAHAAATVGKERK